MYNDFLGIDDIPTENERVVISSRASKYSYDPAASYEDVRFGNPSGVVDFEKVSVDRKVLMDHFIKYGYADAPLRKINPKFRKHVSFFRSCLDLWENSPGTKVFDKSEIYFRCLSEGHPFTEKVKKMRSTCFRARTAETDTDIDEEYYSDVYDSYNSILHERYLIHWDDTKDVDDVKYAFCPVTKERKEEFSHMLDVFWERHRLDEVNIDKEFDMIGALKNTKMYDPYQGKSSLMRDFWRDDINENSPYFAKRVVVPTTPGSTRDTGLGDPSTILRVKKLNYLARAVSEKVPYSTNCESTVANRRIRRVLKNNLFLHLDFKKFGLTFPRYMMNIMIRKMGRSFNIDVSDLVINDFYVEINGECYRTERGTMLGWLDAINSLCICVILDHLAQKVKFDFVTFNDDVEISKKGISDQAGTLSLLRIAVLTLIDFFDIPISIQKTYGSKCSVFLERYAYYEQYGIDMYKDQLTINIFAKSLTTEIPWLAKLYFSIGHEWNKSKYAEDRCVDTCPVEFRMEEKSMPLWSGGFYLRRTIDLDYSLVESDRKGIRLGSLLSTYKPQRYSKDQLRTDNDKIWCTIQNKAYHSYDAQCAELHNGWVMPSISEINDELEYIYHYAQVACDTYQGRDENLPGLILDVVNKLGQEYLDPGGEPRGSGDVLHWLMMEESGS